MPLLPAQARPLTGPIHWAKRLKSTSPYGRSHLRKQPSLPPPVIPQFKQRVILSDGSTFTHFTTSPRSIIRLTRDLTNNPFWSPGTDAGLGDEESGGRMGRFRRKFEADGAGGSVGAVGFEETMKAAPLVEQSNALKVAAKMNLGGKYKATKLDEKKGKKK